MALPQGYTPPQKTTGAYTMSALKSGDTIRLRLLSDFITGHIVWSDEPDGKRKPYRAKLGENIPVGKIGSNRITGMPERIRQFMAAVCWNYTTERIEIFETDKQSILEQLYAYELDADYGDAKGYDIKVSKSGSGMDTKYTLVPTPPSKTSEVILKKYQETPVNLEALYRGDDPFSTTPKAEVAPAEVMQTIINTDDIPF